MTKLLSAAATLKAERERDMAQATREYQKKQDARSVNMLRLRALRLAKECAEAKATAAMQPRGKKASAPKESS